MINWFIHIDQHLALFINSFSGRLPWADFLFKGLANDYFLPVFFGLILLALWFEYPEDPRKRINQTAVVQALISLGLANGFVAVCNLVFFRSRPFNEIPVHILINRPSDSSFPSNMATVLFAVAYSVCLSNRKIGRAMLVLAGIVALGRVYVGMHYPSDVIGGAVFGIITAVVVQKLFFLVNPLYKLLIRLAGKYYIA